MATSTVSFDITAPTVADLVELRRLATDFNGYTPAKGTRDEAFHNDVIFVVRGWIRAQKRKERLAIEQATVDGEVDAIEIT